MLIIPLHRERLSAGSYTEPGKSRYWRVLTLWCRAPLLCVIAILDDLIVVDIAALVSLGLIVLSSLHGPTIVLTTILLDTRMSIFVDLDIHIDTGAIAVVTCGLAVSRCARSQKHNTQKKRQCFHL
jgi:hypothetical protein